MSCEKKLSIIVTVYNKEKYLSRCLDSCVNQIGVEPKEYEILAVNDGSLDNSLSLLSEYSRIYDNITVIDQQNQGLSMARNVGLDAASGIYIWFVDSDDYISEESVKLIFDAIESTPDIIPIYAQTEGKDFIRNRIPVSATNGRDILLSMKWTHCGPFYIYKRSFLIENNFRYMPGIYHEDSELTPRLLYFVKSSVVVPHILYTVFTDPESITQTLKIKRAFDNLFVATRLYDFATENLKNDKKLRTVYNYNVAQLFNNGLYIVCKFTNEDQRKFSLEAYSNRRIFEACRNSILKYRIEGYLLSIFPRNSTKIYRIMNYLNVSNK